MTQGKYPLSVFIIAKDEEDRIPDSIKSVIDWVEEVIVIDSGSSDQTVSISEALGAKVLFNEWNGYGPQKVFGESKCNHPWILNIDADEAVSPGLQAEIKALFDQQTINDKHAYHIPIKISTRFATKLPGRFAPSNDPIRLYHTDYAGFKDSSIHDSVVPKSNDASIGHLKNIMIHRCFRSYQHAVEKINFYSSMQAEHMWTKGRKPSKIRILIEPIISFLKAYTLRRYFLLGIDGFIESVIYAFSRTLRLAKAHEKWKEEHKKAQEP
ncbi:MAG: glycosyltransferase family 2 protein [Rickettsiales bacterium]|nr:glycosyltransferase family 2 protein [Rickettsiales bacterium]